MKTRAATANEIDELAHALPERIWLLGRLFWRRGQRDITRTEAGLLNSLSDGPRRITELVGRLEERGWVTRERDPDDRRAVLVSHTPSGLTALEQMRSESRIMMHEHLSALEENEVHSLVAANDALAALVEQIQQGS
jgi:DNA-binding PadR family transcriptional regulator